MIITESQITMAEIIYIVGQLTSVKSMNFAKNADLCVVVAGHPVIASDLAGQKSVIVKVARATLKC